MKAIISDIHGNFEALKEVLKYIDNKNITEIYCLGDIVGYYSQVNECCEELRSRNVKCIIGNHDWYMISGSLCARSNSVNDCLKYQRKVITQENFDWLYNNHLFIKEDTMSMVHGGWLNPIDEYLDPKPEYFEKLDGKFFFSGHTHLQILKKYKNKIYCNPGSVGQPRDNDPRAAFAIFDEKNEKIELVRVKYNIKKVGELMEKVGFSGYYYGCLSTGNKNLCWSKENV